MIIHHARLVVTNTPDVVLDQVKIDELPNTEILTQEFISLSISDVRRLVDQAYQTPGDKSFRLLVVIADSIAPEAQHALLKILEEPPLTTRFLFIMPSVAGLLATVLSRMKVEYNHAESANSGEFASFCKMSLVERLSFIAVKTKNKDDLVFNQMKLELTNYLDNTNLPTGLKSVLHDMLLYLRLKGASKKMVWEEIAMTIPKAD